MKKKTKIVGFILFLGLLTGIYIFADQTIVETKNLHSSMMISYDDYNDHYNASDLVVVGELVGEPKNVITPFGENNQYVDGHHLSKVKITKVLKGQEELTKKVINVREPYYIADKGIAPGVVEVFYGDYTKMEKGAQYVLFLGWKESWGEYGVSSSHEGKINIDGKDKEEEKMARKNEKTKKFKDDVLDEIGIVTETE